MASARYAVTSRRSRHRRSGRRSLRRFRTIRREDSRHAWPPSQSCGPMAWWTRRRSASRTAFQMPTRLSSLSILHPSKKTPPPKHSRAIRFSWRWPQNSRHASPATARHTCRVTSPSSSTVVSASLSATTRSCRATASSRPKLRKKSGCASAQRASPTEPSPATSSIPASPSQWSPKRRAADASPLKTCVSRSFRPRSRPVRNVS